MKLLKSAAAMAAARTIYAQARRPENQEKVRALLARMKSGRRPAQAPPPA